MVLIPNDLGLRLKLQTEAQLLQPTAPVAEIPRDLPELRPGQRFTARILEALPEHTYKALVGGKNLTLSLPDAAKAGDTLELVVVDRSPQAVFARLAIPDAAPDEAPEPYPHASLSRTGQLLAALQPEGSSPRRPLSLGRGEPLLAAPPSTGAALSQALSKAIRQSGLFYESHQAQWTTGAYALDALLQEPQAQHSDFARIVAHLVQRMQVPSMPMPPGGDTATAAPRLATGGDEARNETPSMPATPPNAALARGSAMPSEAAQEGPHTVGGQPSAPAVSTPESMPEDLRNMVQQQLEVGATQRLVLHGELWPQQHVDIEVERDPQRGAGREDDADAWVTQMTLTTPGLGALNARIDLRGTLVAIRLAATDENAESRLHQALPRLAAALETTGLQPGLLQVRRESVEEAGGHG